MGFLEGILYMLWRGVAIGVIISAPMGPVGILCVQRTLAKGRNAGFYTGVGAALSDLFYCLLTGFGLSFIEDFLEENQNVIQLVGSVVLIGFAVFLFKSNPSRSIRKPGEDTGSPKRDILNGFLFTVSNPLIIFLIIGLFARFNFLLPEIQFGHYMTGFLCIILGALGWWWMVTFFVDKVRAHFNLRSMWLINKITGSIIGLFGAVGIITSIVGLAGAAEPQYLNSARGFGALTDYHVLLADEKGPVTLNTGNSDFTLEFRARNLHNEAGRRYDDGVRNPAWHILLPCEGDTLDIRFKTVDDVLDPHGPRALQITVATADSLYYDRGLRDGVEWFTGWNAWHLSHQGDAWRLRGGDREHRDIAEWSIPGFRPEEASFTTDHGGMLELDWIKIETPDASASEMDYVADPDVLRSYMQRSDDPMEGVWEMFDRSLDEQTARPGGNYRLVSVADGQGGYDLLYYSGAQKNGGYWKPGMLKARLRPTGFDNIYDVEWRDASGLKVESEIKAEYRDPYLEFQLPYLNSSFRMRAVAQ